MRRLFFAAVCLATGLTWAEAPPPAEPADAPPATDAPAAAPAPASDVAKEAPVPAEETPPKKDRGVFLAGVKVALALPLDGLGPMAGGSLEVGYVLPVMKRAFAVTLDVGYTQPAKDGTTMGDPRVTGQMGTYAWHITQQELTISAAVYYRLAFLGRVVPFLGVGPRIYLHKSTVQGSVGATSIDPTTEVLTKVGLWVPVGVAVRLGPGELVAEAVLEYGRIDDVASGWASSAGVNLQVGYRFAL